MNRWTAALLLVPFGLCSCAKPDWDLKWANVSSAAIDRHDAGLFAEALPIAVDSLRIAEREFGGEEFRTVYSLDLLGRIHRRRGDLTGAEALLARAVDANEAALKPDDPKKAFYLNNLADALSAQGKFDEAETLYTRSLLLHRKAAGEFSSYVAADWSRIATLYKDWGLYRRAEQTFRRVDAISKRLDDPDPAVNAGVASGMCGVHLKRGWPKDPRPLHHNLRSRDPLEDVFALCRKALELKKSALSPIHPDLAESLSDMGLILARKKRFKEAEGHLKRAIGIYGRNPGADDRRLAEAWLNTAELHAARGDKARAEELYARFLPRYEELLGMNHYAVIRLLMDMGDFYAGAGEYDIAEMYYSRAAGRHTESPEADRSDREILLRKIGELNAARGDYAKAEGFLRRAVEANEIEHGPGDHSVLDSLYALSRVHAARKQPGKAGKLAERMYRILEKNLGPKHPANRAALDAIQRLQRSLAKRELFMVRFIR